MTKAEKVLAVSSTSKNYPFYSISTGIVEKIFNRGNGALSLYRFGESNKVVVNTLLETKADRKNLLSMIPDAEIVLHELGYPDWYKRTLPDPDAL